MMRLGNKRAVSPVIATVILVAIAITLAVAVAFWIGGITGQYTRFEKIEVQSAYCQTVDTSWNVTLDVRNTGTTQASIINVFVNSKAIGDYGTASDIKAYNSSWVQVDFASNQNIPITPGSGTKVYVTIAINPTDAAYTFSPGTTVEVSLHSAAGNDYMKMITLT